jgi:hypothetical protein
MEQHVVERHGAGVPGPGWYALPNLAEHAGQRRQVGGADVHQLVPPQVRRREVREPQEASGHDDAGEEAPSIARTGRP